MDETRAADWKAQYEKAKTWGEADRLVEQLTAKEHLDLYGALQTIKEWMGLDMRQEFYMSILRRTR